MKNEKQTNKNSPGVVETQSSAFGAWAPPRSSNRKGCSWTHRKTHNKCRDIKFWTLSFELPRRRWTNHLPAAPLLLLHACRAFKDAAAGSAAKHQAWESSSTTLSLISHPQFCWLYLQDISWVRHLSPPVCHPSPRHSQLSPGFLPSFEPHRPHPSRAPHLAPCSHYLKILLLLLFLICLWRSSFILFFLPVLLIYKWHTALYKFKVGSIMVWRPYIMKWWPQ